MWMCVCTYVCMFSTAGLAVVKLTKELHSDGATSPYTGGYVVEL